MANWAALSTTDPYATILALIDAKLDDVAYGFDVGSPSNLKVDFLRFNSAQRRVERWNGSAWEEWEANWNISADRLGGFAAALYPRLAVANVFSTTQTIRLSGLNTGLVLDQNGASPNLDIIFQDGGVSRATIRQLQSSYDLRVIMRNVSETEVNRFKIGQTDQEVQVGVSNHQVWHEGASGLGALPAPLNKTDTGEQVINGRVTIDLATADARHLTLRSTTPSIFLYEDDGSPNQNQLIRAFNDGDLSFARCNDSGGAEEIWLQYDRSSNDLILPGTLEPGLRIRNDIDATLASVDHPLTIGNDGAANVAFDNNEILARNNGAAASLQLNADQIVTGGPNRIYLPTQVKSESGTVAPTGMTANTLGDHGSYYGFDTGTVAGVLNFPASPQTGMIIGAVNRSSNNPITVNRGGTDIFEMPGGEVTSFNLDREGDHVLMQYRGATRWVPISFSRGPYKTGAIATTSGTTKEILDVPPSAFRITLNMLGTSPSGGDDFLVQMGAGSWLTNGYASAWGAIIFGTSSSNGDTAGFRMRVNGAGNALSGSMILTRGPDNKWTSQHNTYINATAVGMGGGSRDLAGDPDRIRLLMTGTNTFDAGEISWLIEY